MLKYNKNSEEINPWTFRHRQTSREFNDPSEAIEAATLTKGWNGERRPKAQPTLHFNRIRIGTELKPVINEISERTFSNKIPTLSLEGEAIAQIEKMSPSYKFISFEYKFKPLKKKNRERRLPNVSLSLKQYTQGMEVVPKREEKLPREYEKVLKVKRYFTVEKDYEDREIMQRKVAESELVQASKTEEVRKGAGVKIVKICKGINSKQEILTRGRLYDQIQTIYDRRGKDSGGHLSQMKRNYNIKKLQRLIRQENT